MSKSKTPKSLKPINVIPKNEEVYINAKKLIQERIDSDKDSEESKQIAQAYNYMLTLPRGQKRFYILTLSKTLADDAIKKMVVAKRNETL